MNYQYIVVLFNYAPPQTYGPFPDEKAAQKYASAKYPFGGYWLTPLNFPDYPQQEQIQAEIPTENDQAQAPADATPNNVE